MKKVITYGSFDLFHEGHYRLLQRAKALGDYLIVGVTTESYDRYRGKLNVVDSLMTRMENVKKTGFADEIIIEEGPGQKYSDIKKYGVDIFTVGSDWIGTFDYLRDICEVVYLERTKDISSTMLRERNEHIQRIGIIGSGRIAKRFKSESVAVSGINVQGVYNPHRKSAETFAAEQGIRAYWDLEKFYEDVDSVYIASPHETHYGYIKSSLEYGKHVMCEKPLVLKEEEAKEVYDLAKKKGLILFECIKTAYTPGFQRLIGIAGSGMIGAIRNIEACFTKLERRDSRELTDTTYGGSFTELGSYVMLPAIKLLGTEFTNLRFDSIEDDNGIDLFTRATVRYSHALVTMTCGLGVKSEGRLLISGTKGYIVVDAPWWKTTYFEVHFEDASRIERYTDRFLGDGLRYEISDFLYTIHGSEKHSSRLTSYESITMAGVMESFLMTRHTINK